MRRLLLGQLLSFAGDPFREGPGAARHTARGAVLLDGGRIAEIGDPQRLRQAWPEAAVHDYGQGLISAGFVDAHLHYPQTGIIASWGRQLLDWLQTYTFPEELRFGDPGHAARVASTCLDLTLAQGTTTVCTYCTVHPESVDAFFEAAASRGLRALAGKTCMDRNAPQGLTDDPQRAYEESRQLLQRWHGRGRLGYVITPRFVPTCSPGQLEALSSLWDEHPELLLQTHLGEQLPELAWVAALCPEARDYLDVYEQHGLLREGAVFGHAIHLAPRERQRLEETGASLVHCPTSNTFIGSGLFDLAGLARGGARVGLATDVGAGSSFSMLRSMAAAYEIAQLRGESIHPSALYWLATQGSARALHLEDKVGNLAVGMEADLVVLDLASTPAISQRAERAGDFWEALFPTLMMGDDRAVQAVWVGGRLAVGGP